MRIKPWWERWPGRLEYELEQLEKAGIPVEQDQDAFDRNTVLLRLRPVVAGIEIKIIAVFPGCYPYMRFEVYAPELSLKQHQNPFEKNLCMLGRATANWNPSDTLADFILRKLPVVIAKGNADDSTASDEEEHQGEPITDFYPYLKDSLILTDSSWLIDPSYEEGKLDISLTIQGNSFMGAVINIKSPNGTILASSDESLHSLYTQKLIGKWIRLDKPIIKDDPEAMLKEISDISPSFNRPLWNDINKEKLEIIGITFPEEVEYKKKKDGWLFIIRKQILKYQKVKKRKQARSYVASNFVKSGRAGKIDLIQRIPELAGLSDKKVAIVGLGCLGAPCAIELAKAGVGELRILDHDTVDAGTIIRWPLGLQHAGERKAIVLNDYIGKNYPFTKVLPFVHRIGEVSKDEKRDNSNEMLSNLFDGIDIILDATAERGVQYLLSDLAAEYGIPYIGITTTEGAWGGQIIRILPDKTKGCWMCFMIGIEEGTIPLPNTDSNGRIQPIGCAEPTFTGSSFDTSAISTTGVRAVISTLLPSYPLINWDIATVNLRDKDGKLISPQWDTQILEYYPSCKCHNRS